MATQCITRVVLAWLALSAALPVCAQTERLINVRDMYPSMSPNGRQLVFQSNRSGSNQVYVMDVEDKTTIRLTDLPLGAETPQFSPDGTLIVFAAYLADDNNDVFIMNADGSDLKQLTSSPGWDGHPHFSADGERIVFNSDRSTPEPGLDWGKRWHEIYSMAVDGTDVRQHTQCKSVCTFGSLSPDGRKVLYRKVTDTAAFDWDLQAITRNSEIFTCDPGGGNELNLSNNAAFDGWPMWSPDGRRIAFASNRTGPANTGQIWLMNPDGSGLEQVSRGPWAHAQPAWSGDGKLVYAYQFVETPEYEFGSVVKIKLSETEKEP